jgi:hypothetical protein
MSCLEPRARACPLVRKEAGLHMFDGTLLQIDPPDEIHSKHFVRYIVKGISFMIDQTRAVKRVTDMDITCPTILVARAVVSESRPVN